MAREDGGYPVRWKLGLGDVSGEDMQILMAGSGPGQDPNFGVGSGVCTTPPFTGPVTPPLSLSPHL